MGIIMKMNSYSKMYKISVLLCLLFAILMKLIQVSMDNYKYDTPLTGDITITKRQYVVFIVFIEILIMTTLAGILNNRYVYNYIILIGLVFVTWKLILPVFGISDCGCLGGKFPEYESKFTWVSNIYFIIGSAYYEYIKDGKCKM